ncbi:MAG TPA: hypothetical protein VGH27_01835 [Streptosporangiaceae bacterium]|jgi:hypothetical protein
MKLGYFFVAVEYYDHHVKCQAWPSELITQTDRLVFSPDPMNKDEQQAFGRTYRNWRRNPCMARYPINDGQPELICERGDDRTWRWLRVGNKQPPQVRGWPVGIEFLYIDSGAERSYHFDANWIRDTAALEFRRDPARNGGFAITRIEPNRNRIDLDVTTAGTSGTMPCRVPPDHCPCWYGSHARAKRC